MKKNFFSCKSSGKEFRTVRTLSGVRNPDSFCIVALLCIGLNLWFMVQCASYKQNSRGMDEDKRRLEVAQEISAISPWLTRGDIVSHRATLAREAGNTVIFPGATFSDINQEIYFPKGEEILRENSQHVL